MSIGPSRPNQSQQQHQQRMIVQQLQLGVQMSNIAPQILNLPLTEQTVRSIQQLLNLQQTYQQTVEQLLQVPLSILTHCLMSLYPSPNYVFVVFIIACKEY